MELLQVKLIIKHRPLDEVEIEEIVKKSGFEEVEEKFRRVILKDSLNEFTVTMRRVSTEFELRDFKNTSLISQFLYKSELLGLIGVPEDVRVLSRFSLGNQDDLNHILNNQLQDMELELVGFKHSRGDMNFYTTLIIEEGSLTANILGKVEQKYLEQNIDKLFYEYEFILKDSIIPKIMRIKE